MHSIQYLYKEKGQTLMIVWRDFILVATADKGAGAAASRVLRLFVGGERLMVGNRRTKSF